MKRTTGLLAAVVLAASLVPLDAGGSGVFALSVLAHLAGYGTLAWLVTDERSVGFAVLAAAGFGLAVEGLQALVAWRTASLLDAATNLAGALVGAGLARLRSDGQSS